MLLPSPGWDYTLQLPHDPLAPRIARRALRLILEEHGGTRELADTAELLTSELVTNSFRHTEGPASMRVRREGERVRVSVWDTSANFPVHKDVDEDAEQGRGIALVELCADAWGGLAMDDGLFGSGKTIWFELDGTWPEA
ncbi:ATP-binding protein [Streptomyces sp. XD-27]|uniref:ATP-binding protein n=1 Tax=Streptomyces sp. XD-27 TaxID=3062779 RepID=UPI0026F40FFF|nr:ATP-binding protein [Streptomyces sp. XD-27]WKX71872.1 ATP-binding protein [Streptomyces sp. XD-27]